MIKLNLSPDRRMLRQFAWLSLVAFPLVGLVLRWQFGLPWHWVAVLAGVGVLVFLVQIVAVPLVSPAVASGLEKAVPRTVFQVLSLAAIPIGLVLSWTLLALIYYVMFTLVGLIFRLIGRDAMRRRLDPAAVSYWIDRGPPRPRTSYFKLY